MWEELSTDYLRSIVIGAGFMTGAAAVIGLLQAANKVLF